MFARKVVKKKENMIKSSSVNVHEFTSTVFLAYHIFLLVWVIGGLGYLLMIIGFITKGMRSRKIVQIEKILAQTVKNTPLKIRNELRSILHEYLFMRVKPVYKGEFQYTPQYLDKSQSCPDITIWREKNFSSLGRKRAFSECYKHSVMERVQSESELDKIDKELTFRPSDALMKQRDLLLKVVDALSLASSPSRENLGVQGFSNEEILASEQYEKPFKMMPQRRRAVSDVNPPDKYSYEQSINTWYGNDASAALKKFKQKRAMSVMPSIDNKVEKKSLFQRFQRTVTSRLRREDQETDIEKQVLDIPRSVSPTETRLRSPSLLSNIFKNDSPTQVTNQNLLEQTSIADFIRALSDITLDENYEPTPHRKNGTANLTHLSNSRRKISIVPSFSTRRNSLMDPSTNIRNRPRRFSMRPVDENTLSSIPIYPPPTSARNSLALSGERRFNVGPVINVSAEKS